METLECKCGSNDFIAIEYRYDDPYHYDGVSEWRCEKCSTRYSRWTGKELKKGEQEKPYGK